MLFMNKIFLLIAFVICYSNTLTSLQQNHHSSQNKLEQNLNEYLSFQKAKLVQIYPGVTKEIQINKYQLSKYSKGKQQTKVLQSFALGVKSIVGMAEIHVQVFQKNSKQAKVLDLSKGQQKDQSSYYSLDFLQDFIANQTERIQLNIRAATFSVIRITLINNQIPDEISFKDLQRLQQPLKMVPIWLPSSYDPQKDKYSQLTKYVYFNPDGPSKKLNIKLVKGHPKIFLYNCQADRINFCRQEITNQHIQGVLMFQKQLEIQLKKQPNCKSCLIIIAFKNMGVQTQLQVTHHPKHFSIVLSKGQPVLKQLKKNQQIQIFSYFSLNPNLEAHPSYLQMSINDGHQKDIVIQFLQITHLGVQQTKNNPPQVSSDDFIITKKGRLIRVIFNYQTQSKNSIKSMGQNSQNWFKIKIGISSKSPAIISIADLNGRIQQQTLLNLNDGQIFHTQVYQSQEMTNNRSYQFRVELKTLSTLTVSSLCTQFNNLQISYWQESMDISRISPKIFIQNVTSHNKKCSQLIHLNSSKQSDVRSQNEDKSEIIFNISGIDTQIDLLFSSMDIIMMQKSFPYHSQLGYNQAMYFYVKNIRNQIIIKIQKCSDCQIILSYSQEQLADMKAKRNSQIVSKQVSSIQASYLHQIKGDSGLYIKLRTNNFAHFVVEIEDVEENISDQDLLASYDLNQNQNQQSGMSNLNLITYSLQQNNKLDLQFYVPKFLLTQNLNSITYFSLVQGSIRTQVARQTYCPQFIFTQKQKTRDISISPIYPELVYDQSGNEKMTFSMQLKHHDFFGIRAQKGSEFYNYQVVNIQMMKEYSQNRWSIFNVLLFLTFALFMSFVCFMGLKRKKVRKIGGEVIIQSEDGQQTTLTNLK